MDEKFLKNRYFRRPRPLYQPTYQSIMGLDCSRTDVSDGLKEI